jgi:hypothetical protein
MAVKSYTVLSQTFRLGRVVLAGETIEIDEDLARGDVTLREKPAKSEPTAASTTSPATPAGKVGKVAKADTGKKAAAAAASQTGDDQTGASQPEAAVADSTGSENKAE